MCKRLTYVVLAVFCLALVSASAARADLIGWWRFEEGSGDTAHDSSGNGHDGTLLGTPDWGTGPVGSGGQPHPQTWPGCRHPSVRSRQTRSLHPRCR